MCPLSNPLCFLKCFPEVLRTCGAAVKTAFSVNWESFSALRKSNGLFVLNCVGSRLGSSQSDYNFLFAPEDFLVLLQSE